MHESRRSAALSITDTQRKCQTTRWHDSQYDRQPRHWAYKLRE